MGVMLSFNRTLPNRMVGQGSAALCGLGLHILPVKGELGHDCHTGPKGLFICRIWNCAVGNPFIPSFPMIIIRIRNPFVNSLKSSPPGIAILPLSHFPFPGPFRQWGQTAPSQGRCPWCPVAVSNFSRTAHGLCHALEDFRQTLVIRTPGPPRCWSRWNLPGSRYRG